MKCPRDGSILAFGEERGHMCNRCATCHGLVLDDDEMGRALGAKHRPGAGRLASLPASGLACPRDGEVMRRLVHQEIELDICPRCQALWLDAGEIEKIRARGGTKRKAVLAAGAASAAVGGVAAASAAGAPQSSLLGGAAELVGTVAAEGVIDLACEFAVEAIGAVLGGLF